MKTPTAALSALSNILRVTIGADDGHSPVVTALLNSAMLVTDKLSAMLPATALNPAAYYLHVGNGRGKKPTTTGPYDTEEEARRAGYNNGQKQRKELRRPSPWWVDQKPPSDTWGQKTKTKRG